MGFLSKIFKPVSKVLDKIIPNEIKPALPYLAAFAPMMLGPGIMGSGMAQRALMSGGMNIFGQLSQEGNEGDINLLSAGLGALSGAMTAPGTPGKAIGVDKFDNTIYARGTGAGSFKDFAQTGIDKYGADSAMGEILGGAAKASKFMTDPGLMKYGIPVAQGTGDVMFAEAERAQDAYEDSQAADSEADAASDARRAAAIRQSMEAYGFTDEEIEDAIYAAGYKTGGRVGLEFGGIPAALENIEDDEMKDTAQFVSAMDDMDIPIMDIVEDFEIQFKRKPNSLEELKQYYKEKYDYKGPGDVRIQETMEESFRETAAKGGRIGFRDGSSTGSFGADRYASELIEAYNSMLNKGDVLLTDAEKIIAAGEYPSAEQFKNIDDRYEQLQKGFEKEENKFTNDELEDSMLDKDALKYYIKKEKELEDREAKLEEKDLELGSKLKETDISGILRTPEFQEWYGLWSKKDPKADDLPSAEYFERLMFDVKRPEYMKKKYDIEMKEGGLMDLGGKEMDMRGGGFIPIGEKEKADDVPARLSKNEFVMTADAVRAAGGGSVNEGAKRMYETMNKLEAKV